MRPEVDGGTGGIGGNAGTGGEGGGSGAGGAGGVGGSMLCADVDCDDQNECTTDTCDPADGECAHTNVTDGTSCDFGDLPGVCGAGVCEDAMLCAGVDCDDQNECTSESCDPADGECDYTNMTAGMTCDFSGLPGVCGAGVCEDPMPCAGVDCDDGNECTRDVCDPMEGQCGYADVMDGTTCDFGGLPGVCTAGTCEDAMLCSGVDCDDGNECTQDVCDPMDGQCDHADVMDGTRCDFGGVSGVCTAGVCGQSNVDWMPPEVVDFTVTPVTFDASSAAVTLNWCVTARDDLSGLDRVVFINAGRVDTPGVGLPGQYQGSRPSFSGELEGTVCGTVVIPQFAPIGRYIVTLLLEDRTGNRLTAAHPDSYQPGTFPGADEQDLCTVGVCEVQNLGPPG